MKQVALITPVPQMVETIVEQSILRKAMEKNIAELIVIDLREFGKGNYRQIDGTPFGGGSGMVLMAEPLIAAIEQAMDGMGKTNDIRVIHPSPQGLSWNHQRAESLIEFQKLIFICSHYKGIDQRIIDAYVTEEYSIGDYVVSSGEIPAIIMADSIIRLIPGVLNSRESAETDSFYDQFLDHPHYTKPRKVGEMEVPEVLLNGHHQQIRVWRQSQRQKITQKKRPDLWQQYLEKNDLME